MITVMGMNALNTMKSLSVTVALISIPGLLAFRVVSGFLVFCDAGHSDGRDQVDVVAVLVL